MSASWSHRLLTLPANGLIRFRGIRSVEARASAPRASTFVNPVLAAREVCQNGMSSSGCASSRCLTPSPVPEPASAFPPSMINSAA